MPIAAAASVTVIAMRLSIGIASCVGCSHWMMDSPATQEQKLYIKGVESPGSYYHENGFVDENEARRFMIWSFLNIGKKHSGGHIHGRWVTRTGDTEKLRGSDFAIVLPVVAQAWIYAGKSTSEAAQILGDYHPAKRWYKRDARGHPVIHPGRIAKGGEGRWESFRNTYQRGKTKRRKQWAAVFDLAFGGYLSWRAHTRISPKNWIRGECFRIENRSERKRWLELVWDLRRDGPEAEFDNPHAQGWPGIPPRPDLISGYIEPGEWCTFGHQDSEDRSPRTIPQGSL